MFESIVHGHRRTTRRDFAPLAISWAVHTLVIGAVVLLPLFFAQSHLPSVPKEVWTFVTVVAPPPPPPPPPPPSSTVTPAARPASTRPVPTGQQVPQAPVVAPRELPPSIEVANDGESEGDFDSVGGVPGGVAGGVPGGVLGGFLGGVTGATLPPPPPPPPPAPRAPIRTGGQIQAPALVKRVAPVYPLIAVNAKVQGVVILEATVGPDGRVEDVDVLRSVTVLDKAAIDAVRQWEYAPLLLNGEAVRFILTVTVSFSLS